MKHNRRVRSAPPRMMLIAWVLPKTYDLMEKIAADVKRAEPRWAKRVDLEKEDCAGRMIDKMAPLFSAKLHELAQTPARRRRARPSKERRS